MNEFLTSRKCVTYIVGTCWGDEGKGRASFYCLKDADICVRATGGDNAGHTVISNNNKFALNLLPAGIADESKICVIGAGVLINPEVLLSEMDKMSKYVSITPDRLKVSGLAHVVLPYHIALDALHEKVRGNGKIGTTGRGIGPTVGDKGTRFGLRVYDLFRPFDELVEYFNKTLLLHNLGFEHFGMEVFKPEDMASLCVKYADALKDYVCNTDYYIADQIDAGKKILIEGAQAAMLSLTHGMYNMVTSTDPTGSGSMDGAEIGPIYASRGIGVMKAYCSKVGEGYFPTELFGELGDDLREEGHEYGVRTGRPRRCGYLDLCIINSVKKFMGLTELCVNHIDTIGRFINKHGFFNVCTSYEYDGKTIYRLPADLNVTHKTVIPNYTEFKEGWDTTGCKKYADLPTGAKRYLEFIEDTTHLPVTIIGIGPSNEETILK